MPYVDLPNSTYLDFTSYRGNGLLPDDGTAVSSFTFNVALVLERANDPSALLDANWATRQQQLSAMDDDTLWSTYGADPAQYADALSALSDLGISTVDQISAVNGYVSSAESRTIWVQVDETNFTTLFGPGAQLLHASVDGKTITFWEGNLSLPDTLIGSGVKGLMFDGGGLSHPALADPAGDTAVTLPQGAQGVGNSSAHRSALDPNEIASLYNFPFNSASTPDLWTGVQTGTIGLLEPGLGTALPSGSESFQELADAYRAHVGLDTPGVYIDVAPGGTGETESGERSLDLGVVTAISPTSAIAFYAGSGVNAGAHSDVYTAYQAAFWDTTNNPEVVSSSWADLVHFAPDSPFAFAYNELYVDAVLRNITVVNSAGDGGSGGEFGNGLTNVQGSHASPYSIVVGGSSLSTLDAAAQDTTLTSLVSAATARDPATLWALVAGGLTTLPSKKKSDAYLLETVWNGYFVVGNEIVNKSDNGGGYNSNEAGAGGVDPSQPQPSYQTDYGLNLTTSDPSALPGRGVPDVAALAGGNLGYNVPTEDMTGTHGDGGTSASAPLWAALVAQFNALFRDQELPQLGYMNDLLYIAAAIAPAAFNDVTLGNNTSSFSLGGPYLTPAAGADGKTPEEAITPTGYGRSRLRSDDRTGYAQRYSAGARADDHRAFADVVRVNPRRAGVKRLGRLDKSGGPEPAGPDDVGCVQHRDRFQRFGQHEHRQSAIRHICVDQPVRPAVIAAGLRRQTRQTVRPAESGGAEVDLDGSRRRFCSDDQRPVGACTAGDVDSALRLCRLRFWKRRRPRGTTDRCGRDRRRAR